jgi:predicted  nucleic acid-binding Zn-ribbon protein
VLREQKIATREEKYVERDNLQTQINDKNAQITSLTAQVNSLNGTINSLNGQINSYDGQIGSLNTQIAAAQQAGNTALVAVLTVQRDAAVAARAQTVQNRDATVAQRDSTQATLNTRVAERDALVVQKAAVEAEITQLTNQINTLTAEIASLEGQMVVANQQYFESQSAMLNVFAQAVLALRELEPAGRMLDFNRDMGILRGFEDIAANIAQFGALMQLRQEQAADQAAILDQIRNDAASQRVLQAAVGLVVGAVELLATLALLAAVEAATSVDPNEAALTQGGRLRIG